MEVAFAYLTLIAFNLVFRQTGVVRNFMNIHNLKIPLVVFVTLRVASIIPVPLVLLMYLNGGLFSLFLTGENTTFYLINAILAVLAIYFIYKSNSPTATCVQVFLYVFFSLPFVRFVCGLLTYETSFDAYSLYLDPFVITIPLLLTSILKARRKAVHI
jgi:hypothetical protein